MISKSREFFGISVNLLANSHVIQPDNSRMKSLPHEKIDSNGARVRLSAICCITGSDFLVMMRWIMKSSPKVNLRRKSIFRAQLHGRPIIRDSRESAVFLDDSHVDSEDSRPDNL